MKIRALSCWCFSAAVLASTPGEMYGESATKHSFRLALDGNQGNDSVWHPQIFMIAGQDERQLPSHCAIAWHVDAGFERMTCLHDATSPLSDAIYLLDLELFKNKGSVVLHCVEGCKPEIPALFTYLQSEE